MQDAPVTGRKTCPITEHQRCQPTLAALGIDVEQTLTHAIAPCRFSRRQQLPGLHATHGADTPGKQGRLPICEMRIDQAGRALEVDRQAPAFATGQRRRAIPAQLHARRQPGPARGGIGQFKTHRPGTRAGQADHPSFQPECAPIQLGRQALVQRPLRRNTGPAQPQQKTAHGIAAKWQQQKPDHRQHDQRPDRR
ncbi:hypothetical protein D9M71_293380 [compost metagenome]